MLINKVIVHELVKDQHKPISNSNYRPSLLDNTNELVLKLVSEINKIYGNRYNSAHYGIFADGDARGAFPDSFIEYSDLDTPTDLQFLKVSHIAMQRLYDMASTSTASSGGYLLFADFVHEGTRFFIVAMIKKTSGIKLSSELMPEELEQLDLSKLHQAARINFAKICEYEDASEEEKKELNYLSFISAASSESATGYFIKALGCLKGSASKQATQNLIQSSRSFFANDERISDKKRDFMSALFGYLQDSLQSSSPVKLSEVANLATRYIPVELGDDAQEIIDNFVSKLNSDDLSIPPEFPVNKTVLFSSTHVTAKASNWELSFDKLALGIDPASEVYFDNESGTVTITQLPDSVLETLREETADQRALAEADNLDDEA